MRTTVSKNNFSKLSQSVYILIQQKLLMANVIIHLNLNMMSHASQPFQISVTNAIHVCKHTKISLHICIHALYTKSFGMCIEGKNLKGTLDLWTLISTLVMTQSSAVLKRERECGKKRKREVINQNLQNAFMISPWTCYLQIFLSVCFLNN